jgi:hypothetical protein
MTQKLRVLVLESERHAADAAIAELTAAGHTVARCSEPGEPSFPCAAISEGMTCPLDDRPPVDVMLAVRPRPRSQPAPGESGVTCGVQRHIPLVVAGSDVLNPFEPWSTEVLGRTTDVVEACERAAAQPLPRHSARAARALQEVLERHHVPPTPVRVDVVRANGGLVVHAYSPRPLDHSIRSMASVRMAVALREIDAHAAGIDVSFTSRSDD